MVEKNTTTWQVASFGELEILKGLADLGKPLDDQDERGFTPLNWAARNGHLQIIQYLIEEKNCSFEKFSFGGLRPIHHACNKNHEKIVRYLIKSGCDVNATDENGDTALHYAAARGVLNIVIALIDAGAEFSKSNSQGLTPLHKATIFGQLAIVRKFAEAGVNTSILSISDNVGDTALHYASRGGFAPIVKLLLENKANPAINNQMGYKPKEIAANSTIEALFD